jgi:hypothetical protein
MGRQCHERHSLLSYKPSSESTGLLHIDLRLNTGPALFYSPPLRYIRHVISYSPLRRNARDLAARTALPAKSAVSAAPCLLYKLPVQTLYKNPARVLVQELLITNDRAIGASLTSPYGETRIPLATTPPLGGVRWRHDYIRRGKSTPFATIVISCSEQDHMSISVLDNHIFTNHLVRTHSH